MKKTHKKHLLTALMSIVCVLCLLAGSVYAEPQGTEGDELHVLEPQQLEVQLGPEWVSKEFSLKTDVGMYPETIVVGADGILRTELGGSSTYTLSCMVPAEAAEAHPEPSDDTGTSSDKKSPGSKKDMTRTVVIFAVGIVAAIAVLVFLSRSGQKNTDQQVEDDDDEI